MCKLNGDHLDLHVRTTLFPTRRSYGLACLDQTRSFSLIRAENHAGVPPLRAADENKSVTNDMALRPPQAALQRLKQVRGRSDAGRSRGRVPDRKSTRLNSVTNAQLVCRLRLEKKKHKRKQITIS